MNQLILYYFFLHAFNVILVKCEDGWIVNTQYGDVRGYWSEEFQNWQFLGIPYAAAPLGDLRYKAPVPPEPWPDVLNATRTITCIQAFNATTNTEDCLIVNVFVPETARTDAPLPVLFYGFGGAFLVGNSFNYNTHTITRHDVIFVSYNYRLGPLGYLCLGTERVPGNAALKDYLTALRWVNKNIENFGGDPNSVTLFGVSAGSVNTLAMAIARATDNLIKGAIFESGSVLADWANSYNRLGISKAVALNLHCPHLDDLDELAKCYENFSVSELQTYMTEDTRHVICLEREFNDIEAVVTKDYKEVIETGDHKKIPMIFVYTSLDGLEFSTDFDEVQADFHTEIKKLLPINLKFENSLEQTEVIDSIKSFYFDGAVATHDTFLNYVNFRTDLMFFNPIYRTTRTIARNSNLPVYLMEFAYKGAYARPNNPPTYNMAGHADVGSFVVGLNTYGNVTPTDVFVRNRMTQMWTNFVKYGNPTPDDSILGIEWPQFTEEEERYLYMDQDAQIRQFPWKERAQFWVDLYEKYYYAPPVFINSSFRLKTPCLFVILSLFFNIKYLYSC